MDGAAGKGDTPRPVDKKKFDQSFVRIMGEKDISDFQKGRKIVISYPKKKEA